jgi:hypothetical protein
MVAGPRGPGDWSGPGPEMVRLDLAAAGIPFEDENGHVYALHALHALRHQFVSDLARAGVPIKHDRHAMDLARQSDVNLTMKRSHAERKTLAEDVNQLPAL